MTMKKCPEKETGRWITGLDDRLRGEGELSLWEGDSLYWESFPSSSHYYFDNDVRALKIFLFKMNELKSNLKGFLS